MPNNIVDLLQQEIKKNILLDDRDRKDWLEIIQNLPSPLQEYFLNFLRGKNQLLDSYVQKALEVDPSLLSVLKNEVRMLKKHFREFQEKETTTKEDAEKNLQDKLKNI